MKYALVTLPLLFAAPAFAQAGQQLDRPLLWSGKERMIRPADGIDNLYREPYTGGGALNRGPYTGGGQRYDLAPQPDQRAPKTTDWTRPVTGVDGPVLPAAATVEQVTQPLTVIAQGQTNERALDDTPLPPPCEPPVTKTRTVKPPPPPCPPPPR